RAGRQSAISVYGGADVCFPRPCHDMLFFIARRSQGDRPGTGADRAAVVHRHRWLVAVDAQCDRTGLLQTGGGLHGVARRAVMRQRDADPMGAEAARTRGEAGAVLIVIASEAKQSISPLAHAVG